MKKIVRLTESELKNIVEKSVRRAIKEGAVDESLKDVGKTVAAGVLGGAALTADVALDGPISKGVERQLANHKKMSQADQATKKEFGKDLSGKKNPSDSIPKQKDIQDTKTRSWTGEARIRRAVMESLIGLMRECDDADKLAEQ